MQDDMCTNIHKNGRFIHDAHMQQAAWRVYGQRSKCAVLIESGEFIVSRENTAMKCLSPSILAADFSKLGEEIVKLDEAGAQYVHIDVADGIFVPSITFGVPVIASIREHTERIFDVHLMIKEPARYINEFAEAGADIITVHAESTRHLDRTIEEIKRCGLLAGVALNPATPLSVLDCVLDKVDMVLIMTVNPGFGGQELIPYTLDKVRDLQEILNKRRLKIDIEVDGGVNLFNVEEVMAAGANIIVAGSAVFSGDVQDNVRQFLNIMGGQGAWRG